MTKIDKARKVLNLISYAQDAVQRLMDSVDGVYGPDEKLSDTELEQKKQVLATISEVAIDSIADVMEPVAEVYCRHYTEEELEQLIEWYSSPLGMKVLAEADRSFVEIQGVLTVWGDKLWKTVQVRMGWA